MRFSWLVSPSVHCYVSNATTFMTLGARTTQESGTARMQSGTTAMHSRNPTTYPASSRDQPLATAANGGSTGTTGRRFTRFVAQQTPPFSRSVVCGSRCLGLKTHTCLGEPQKLNRPFSDHGQQEVCLAGLLSDGSAGSGLRSQNRGFALRSHNG